MRHVNRRCAPAGNHAQNARLACLECQDRSFRTYATSKEADSGAVILYTDSLARHTRADKCLDIRGTCWLPNGVRCISPQVTAKEVALSSARSALSRRKQGIRSRTPEADRQKRKPSREKKRCEQTQSLSGQRGRRK